MQLIRHLNNEELTDLLLEDDQRELQQRLAALPEQLRSTTEQPEWFWQRQQAAIHRRMAATRRAVWPLLTASAGALALLVLALTLPHSGSRPTPPVPQAQTDPDQELMIAVEQAVHTEVPYALEPAALLANEIGKSQATVTPVRFSKENKHANK